MTARDDVPAEEQPQAQPAATAAEEGAAPVCPDSPPAEHEAAAAADEPPATPAGAPASPAPPVPGHTPTGLGLSSLPPLSPALVMQLQVKRG